VGTESRLPRGRAALLVCKGLLACGAPLDFRIRGERVRTVPAWQRYAVNKLRQVLRIGGSPCSGKSSIAHVLAANRGFALYSCDDAFERHAAAITAMHGPTLKKVTTWSVAQRLAQPVEVQVADTLQLYREEFPLITVALRVPLVVEGAAPLPELLAGLRIPVDRAVRIVPALEFQVAHYTQRTWAQELVHETPDPDAAFRNGTHGSPPRSPTRPARWDTE
jgi:hypothetical protein